MKRVAIKYTHKSSEPGYYREYYKGPNDVLYCFNKTDRGAKTSSLGMSVQPMASRPTRNPDPQTKNLISL